MCSWKSYWMAQLKRVLKALPGICLLTVLLSLCLLFFMKGIFLLEESGEEKQVVQVGIVGDLSDTYLGMGIRVLADMEGIRGMVNIRSMTLEEAKKDFAAGEISAYLLVPEGFLDSVLTGENKAITYVTNEQAQGIGGILIDELVSSISKMMTTTQNSVYAMQIYLIENQMTEKLSEAVKGINYVYIDAVLNRMDMYELQLVGVSNRISVMGHLFTGILLLLIMLWGISSVSLMVRSENSFRKLLYVKGLHAPKQVLAEISAYSILQCTSLLCVFGCVILVKEVFGFSIVEWDMLETVQKWMFLCKLLPVILMVSALQALLYELVSNVVTGTLLQFIVSVSMAYLSGCIYPLSFFPEIMQSVAICSPVGAALRYIQKGISLQNVTGELVIILLYCVLFVGLQIIWRNHRIAKE